MCIEFVCLCIEFDNLKLHIFLIIPKHPYQRKTPQEPLTPDRPTELLRAKQRDRTNLAEELFLFTSFITKGAKEDLPQSYDKAIKGPEANNGKKQWMWR